MTAWGDSGARREIDILLFELAGRTYGADVADVFEVSRRGTSLPVVARLGQGSGARALVVRGRHGDGEVPIDKFLGIRRAPVTSLRRLPDFARGLVEPAAVGFLLDDAGILLLLDLQALVDEELSGSTAQGAAAGLGRLGA